MQNIIRMFDEKSNYSTRMYGFNNKKKWSTNNSFKYLHVKIFRKIFFVYFAEKHLYIYKIHDNIYYRWNIYIYILEFVNKNIIYSYLIQFWGEMRWSLEVLGA